MHPASFDVHTATFGPGNPETEPSSYLGQVAAGFEQPGRSTRAAVYPSEPPRPVAALTPDAARQRVLELRRAWTLDKASPLPSSNAVKFGAPGTYDFYCMIHPFMHGTVTVQ